MKTPIRYQSRLLVRRSYKPVRRKQSQLGVTFRPSGRIAVKIVERKSADANDGIPDGVITRSA